MRDLQLDCMPLESYMEKTGGLGLQLVSKYS